MNLNQIMESLNEILKTNRKLYECEDNSDLKRNLERVVAFEEMYESIESLAALLEKHLERLRVFK